MLLFFFWVCLILLFVVSMGILVESSRVLRRLCIVLCWVVRIVGLLVGFLMLWLNVWFVFVLLWLCLLLVLLCLMLYDMRLWRVKLLWVVMKLMFVSGFLFLLNVFEELVRCVVNLLMLIGVDVCCV